MDEANRKYPEAAEEASERFAKASSDSAKVLRDSSRNTIQGLQDYNEKLLEIAQTNVNGAFEFFRQVAVAKSPSEFITVATAQVRRQYDMSSEQVKELTALVQKLALAPAQPVREYAERLSTERPS